MPIMWDLCSGLGGASEAFLANGWEVIRIENNNELGHVPNTIICSVEEFYESLETVCFEMEKPDLIWASPPCLEFSNAYNAPKSVAKRENVDFEPDMKLFHLCEKIIHQVNPEYWVIENVMGAQEYFNGILGEPTQIIESFCLWGEFPRIAMPVNYKHLKPDLGSKNPLRSNYRAKIPYEVSLQLLRAITEQTKLEDWL